MTDLPDSTIPTDETSTRRRGWRWLRALLWGVAALWLLVLSAWLALHVFILPRIDAQRGWLQERLSRALSTPVVIGELQVQGNWLLPWVQASDVVITMGCGDACKFYPGKRYEDWQLDDPAGQGIEVVRPIRDNIKARVQELIASLS